MFQLKNKLLPLAAVDCCLKKWKKMVSTNQKISYISLNMVFLWKLASTSFSYGFHREEKHLKKRKRFPLARKSVSTSRNKRFHWKIRFCKTEKKLAKLSEKWREKIVSTSQKIICPIERMRSFYENCFLVIPILVSTSCKIALTKKMQFPLARKTRSQQT